MFSISSKIKFTVLRRLFGQPNIQHLEANKTKRDSVNIKWSRLFVADTVIASLSDMFNNNKTPFHCVIKSCQLVDTTQQNKQALPG
jgi:hypothetical protein